jgi:hypothetical protein
MRKSGQFVLPVLNLTYSDLVSNGYLGTYLGIVKDDEVIYEYGKFIIIAFHPKRLTADFSDRLKLHNNFKETYKLDNTSFYIFRIPENAKELVYYFIQGKYSYIHPDDRAKFYNYPEALFIHKICMKHPDLYAEWEEKGILLSDEQEVWSAPQMEEEIYHSLT